MLRTKKLHSRRHSLVRSFLRSVQVKDVSGGCGDFFQLVVVSPKFEGVSMIRQHRMVNEVLEAQIGSCPKSVIVVRVRRRGCAGGRRQAW